MSVWISTKGHVSADKSESLNRCNKCTAQWCCSQITTSRTTLVRRQQELLLSRGTMLRMVRTENIISQVKLSLRSNRTWFSVTMGSTLLDMDSHRVHALLMDYTLFGCLLTLRAPITGRCTDSSRVSFIIYRKIRTMQRQLTHSSQIPHEILHV